VPEVRDHTGDLDGLPVFWRSAPFTGAPPLYLHGVPTSSDDWVPFLADGGGVAPDLPGFGRSGKPGHFDYSIDGYCSFLERFFDLAGLDRVRLVVHDWGAVGLAFAQRHPERIERLVVIDAVPLLPGYRWHRLARVWRTPGLGELAMGATTPAVLRFISRESNAAAGPMPQEFLDAAMAHFDHGTQRAILRLYRSAPPEVLEAAGSQLERLQVPSLVVWGEGDPYIPARFAEAYARALGDAELAVLPDAGHWPWIDRPELVARVAAFATAA
jgi:pimeloyl-ACP methyl ester carboxylesterase